MWVLAPMMFQVISEGETLKEELRNTAPSKANKPAKDQRKIDPQGSLVDRAPILAHVS